MLRKRNIISIILFWVILIVLYEMIRDNQSSLGFANLF